MKTIAVRLMLALAMTVTLQAAWESVGIEVTREPVMPAKLRMEGLRDGRVVLALAVDTEGRLTDVLVLVASHRELIAPTLDAVNQWHFRPARLDGARVSAGLELTIRISEQGAVVNRTSSELVAEFIENIVGRKFDYEICAPGQMDAPPVALRQVKPFYPASAQQQGVKGRVRVSFYVDENGDVRMPTVSAQTHPDLSAAAIEALNNWKFSPATRQGHPVLVAAVQDFDFRGTP